MSRLAASSTTPRRTALTTGTWLLVVLAVVTGAVVSLSARTSVSAVDGAPHVELGRSTRPAEGIGAADGVLPDDVTVFDDSYQGVANLAPGLLRALREAATAAGGQGVEIHVNSGWRSPAYQDELLREAVSTYGSADEAARWVATAETSPHVHGHAVDVGPARAAAWLSRHGAAYGLCPVYRNEPWHFELRRSATEHGCPPPYADPTHDPRMRP